jgi:parallel beta-helix repeat protein
MNNNIHNSANAISVYNSQNLEVVSNLIATNNEHGIRLQNTTNSDINHNTLYNNAKNGHFPAIRLVGTAINLDFNKNIIASNHGAGLDATDVASISAVFSRNDLWSNLDGNYVGLVNQTGTNGNISADPLFNLAAGSFCLMPQSPAIYGNVANGEYMGYMPPCGIVASPSPSPTPNSNAPFCGQSSTPPPTGSAPLTVTLHGAGNAGSGTGIVGYRWDFENNGTWDTAVSIEPITHTYTQTGTYHPVFQVLGSNNLWSSVCNYPYSIVVGSGGTPPPTVRPFQVLLKLKGVEGEDANLANVTVRFVSNVLNYTLGYVTESLPIVYEGNGVYRLPFGVWSTDLPASNDYSVVIKGEKHLAIRFCLASGQNEHCTGAGKILIPEDPSSPINLDFTGVPLEPGDLYQQDGKANGNDFTKVIDLLSKPCSELTDQEKLIGDLDYNGCVNIRDAFLMRQTLETRYDEF